MRTYWVLTWQISKRVALYFYEQEGSIAFSPDYQLAQQFDDRDSAETYLGLLCLEHPGHAYLLHKLKVVPHGFN